MRKENHLIIVLLILVLATVIYFFNGFYTGRISSGASCLQSQTILKLSSPENAHGALWNDKEYPEQVCFDMIFKKKYEGENPHQCSEANKILRLSSSSNAHASSPSISGYGVNVCYGNLECRYSANSPCNPEEKCIITLSGERNAHLAQCRSSHPYANKICCKEPASTVRPEGDAYWADMIHDDSQLNEADITDTVRMIWKNTGLPDGTRVRFEIYEEDTLIDDHVQGNIIATGQNNMAIGYWTIEEKDLENARELLEGTYELYFKVAPISGNYEKMRSNILKVEPGHYENTPPVAIIEKPANGDMFNIHEPVEFKSASYDPDDRFTLLWSFGDGNTKEVQFSEKDLPVNHEYSNTGQKPIGLKVTDSRGAMDEDDSNIQILLVDPSKNQKYIFANIEKPVHKSVLTSENVAFDAAGTYVVDCGGGSCSRVGNSILDLNWTFSRKNTDSTLSVIKSLKGSWNDKNHGTAILMFSGQYFANLFVSHGDVSSSRASEFSLVLGLHCSPDGRNWILPDGSTSSSMNHCQRQGVEGACCPSSYRCVDNKCQQDLEDIRFCSQYKTKEACENYDSNVARDTVNRSRSDNRTCEDIFTPSEDYEFIDENCAALKLVNCRCFWEANQCKGSNELMEVLCGDPFVPPEPIGRCVYTDLPPTGCMNGVKTYSWKGEWQWSDETKGAYTPQQLQELEIDPECQDGSREIKCTTPAKLPFFTWANMLSAILILVLFYIFRKRN